MHIDGYDFGTIVINGKTYTTDVIIFPDRVRSEWWRLKGHELHVQDLKCILQSEPKLLIVGTGYYGHLRIPEATREALSSENIDFVAKNTTRACELFNEYATSKQKVVAALHLTC